MSATHQEMANALRVLAMDAVEAAKSGHPGMPMGMADVATVLFSEFLTFDPQWPEWPDRDRFVLSAGHGSMLLYGLLYLTGYPRPTIEDIKSFRQLGSPCAGHPEFGECPGVETTTGPLGQGLATAVGMAIAEEAERARAGTEFCNHYTYVIAGDGCLMEGVSHEAASLAGHQKLGRLIVLWDDNRISIDGSTDLSVSDNHLARFEAQGWDTQAIDGHDPDAISQAIETAKGTSKPSLIACRTTIGFGAPKKQGTAATHGAPLGPDEIAGAREALGWTSEPFDIPYDIAHAWRTVGARGQHASLSWNTRLKAADAATRDEFLRRQSTTLTDTDKSALAERMAAHKADLAKDAPKLATRKSSELALEAASEVLPHLFGGSADLSGSNNTRVKAMTAFTPENRTGTYMHYGVREFGMAAAMNGIALHGGLIPYSGTFLVFSDYARPAIRLSALMKQRVIYVMTHDSIGLGEDGPTHQPVEHLAALRAIPGLMVLRPADAIETAECWEIALGYQGPSVLALSRQGLPTVRAHMPGGTDNLSRKGAYRLAEANGTPAVRLVATGSEIALALDVHAALTEAGVRAEVISVPSTTLLDQSEEADRKEMFGGGALNVVIEAASAMSWYKYVGPDALMVTMDQFGASAPASDLFPHFGFSAPAILEQIKIRLAA
ncbi:MAG: transketolase [Pseudomonadota bacterium]